jgi:hypothetical protein
MPMAQCEFSYKRNGDDTVRCQLLNRNGDCCGNVKFCRMTNHWENNSGWERCPIRLRGIELGKEKKDGKQV